MRKPEGPKQLLLSNDEGFSVRYLGENPEYHEMYADHLAQALQGISEMVSIAHKTLSPEDARKVQVKVNALDSGSFVIGFQLLLDGLEQIHGHTVQSLAAPGTVAAINLYNILKGAIDVVKWVRGRTHKATTDGDTTTITTEDGEQKQVSPVIYKIAGDAHFHGAFIQATKPLEDTEYNRVELQTSSGRVVGEFNEQERDYLSDLSEELRVLDVWVETPQLAAPHRKWTFRHGGQRFKAEVLDMRFLDEVDNGDIHINARTRLRVRRLEQRIVQTDGKIKTNYFIVQVLDGTDDR
ncbi:hypothetical protein [Corynebacterium sp. NML180780]|uniref:hypothetical protein n=1 Tax=Corynebacterium sp. NML180780 TaxID=2598459 RepID=UPI001196FD31|nr:hypothetical protein [Corynebacterium sp. NML180780]TVX76462.1 hypothetical protein FPP74_11120 [Corynebacterium sp. NML180780]